MSTRSRPSFRRSLQSSFFRSVSPAPSQTSPPATLSRSGTATEKSRHARRERVKEAIEQFFDKLHHHQHSESSHVSQDARSTGSHSIGNSASQSSSRNPSVRHVKTNVSLVPYDLSEAQADLITESSSRALRIEDLVIEIKENSVSETTPVAMEAEPEAPTPVNHVRVLTETSVDVIIPMEEEPVPELAPETVITEPLPQEKPNPDIVVATPPASDSNTEEPTSTGRTEPSVAVIPTATSVAHVSEPQSWYTPWLAMIPFYAELRKLVISRSQSSSVRPRKVSAGLLGFFFDNVFTRMAAFAFDMWLLSICYFIVKVLRVRPRVLEKVESWIP